MAPEGYNELDTALLPPSAPTVREKGSKMGDGASRRSMHLHVVVSPDEVETIERQAEAFGMTKSEFVRFAIEAVSACPLGPEDAGAALVYVDAQTWRQLLIEFRMHGVNINQAAKACNTLVRTVGPYIRERRPDSEQMAEFVHVLNETRNILGVLLTENRVIEKKVRDALSLDALLKAGKGWHHARAQG